MPMVAPNNEPDYRESELVDGTKLVRLGGELDVFTAGAEVRELLEECVESACHVVLDMSRVTFIDSAGIGLLVRTHRLLADVDRRLVLLRPDPNVRRIIELTGLDQILAIAEFWPAAHTLPRVQDKTPNHRRQTPDEAT